MHSYWLLTTAFLDLLATSLLVPFLPLQLRSLGLPQLTVGLLVSVFPSVQLFSGPVVGYCADHWGHRRTLLLSLLLCSLVYYVLSTSISVPIIFSCRAVLGILSHTQVLCKSILMDCTNTKTFGMLNAAEALGFMLGPALGAHFIEKPNGFQFLCKITSILFCVNSVIVYYSLSQEVKPCNKSDFKVTRIIDNVSKVSWSVYWDIFILKSVLCISLSLFYTNYTLIIELLQASPSTIGYTNSFQGLVSIVTGLVSGRLSATYLSESQHVKLYHCFVLLSVSLLSTGFVSNLSMLVLCLIPLNFSSTLIRIYTSEMLLCRSTVQSRASMIGVENSIASIAFLLNPFIFEICTTRFGNLSVPFLTFVLTALGAIISGILSYTYNKPKEGWNRISKFASNIIS